MTDTPERIFLHPEDAIKLGQKYGHPDVPQVEIGDPHVVYVRADADAESELHRIKAALAIKGGSESYPTQWAYEQACKALDSWKDNCRANAAAMHMVEEALGQMLPAPIRAGAERGPDPVEWAQDMIAALHTARDHLRAQGMRKAAEMLDIKRAVAENNAQHFRSVSHINAIWGIRASELADARKSILAAAEKLKKGEA